MRIILSPRERRMLRVALGQLKQNIKMFSDMDEDDKNRIIEIELLKRRVPR